MGIIKIFFTVLLDAARHWLRDKASLYAAAIAYYMVFSIAPLLVFAIAIAGRVFGQAAVEGQIVSQVEHVIGQQAAVLLENLLENAIKGSSSFTLISIAVLLWAASGVFNHLKRALDVIYGVIPNEIEGIREIIFILRHRFMTFALVLFMGVILLAVLALNTVAATLDNYLLQYVPGFAIFNTYFARFITPIILLILFSILFKVLPEAKVAWRDVFLGSFITTLLFLVGVYVISFYLDRSNVGSVYGAASSLIVFLVWIYYSAQIMMFGAEFVKAYAKNRGRPIRPGRGATSLADHYNNVLPHTDHEPQPEPVERVYFGETFNEPAAPEPPSHQTRKHIAAGLIGLAVGLFLGFIGQFLQDD